MTVPLGRGFAGRVAAERRPILVEDLDDIEPVSDVLRERGIRSLLGVPILVEERLLGVLHVGTFARRRFEPRDVQLLQMVADRVGLGIAYARLYGDEHRARARAERERERSRFLADVSALLSSMLDHEETLRMLARRAVPQLGDCCVIDLLVESEAPTRRIAVAHADPSREPLLWEMAHGASADPDSLFSPARVVAVGQPVLVADVTAVAQGPEQPSWREGLVSFMSVPLVARGRTLGVMAFATSISGRRYTHADLVLAQELAGRAALAVDNARLYREAQEANRLKDEFLATLSHELRTPVTSVLGWMWMLRHGRLEEAAAARALGTMEGSMRSLLRIIDDLLDVSRMIHGPLRLELRPVEIAQVVRTAIDAVRPTAKAKGILIDTAIDPTAGLVEGDAGRLQQIVWNLLTNAIKFTPSGGHVQVRLERRDEQVRVAVRDTGMGIPAEFLPHLFERFRQADATSTRPHGGLGLGLAIVRHLVELHGGTIDAASPGPGGGATFTVTLPAPAAVAPAPGAAAPAAETPPAAEHGELAGVRVLFVEDEDDTRAVVGALLAAAGARVRAVSSAAEALAVLRRWTPHVLVSDIAMPGEDGYALLRKVRALAPEEGGLVPAVALTAYAGAEDRRRALAAGFQEHVAKPFDPPALAAVVARLARTALAPAPRASGPRPARTILLVEDDAGTREYERAVLEQLGHRVVAARSADEGLAAWAANRDRVDLVVTDLVMAPGRSGAGVCRTVHRQRPNVPVIVLTAYPAVAEMLLDPRAEGVVACLQKPIDVETLAAAVTRAVQECPRGPS